MSNWINTTRTITLTEYNNLQRRAKEAATLSARVGAMATLNQNLQNRLDNAQERINRAEADARRTRTELQRINAEHNARHEAIRNELANVIANTDARIEAADKENRERMERMSEEFGTRLSEAIESNNRNIEAAMNRNNEIINGRIDELRDSTNEALAEIHTTLDDIVHGNDDLLNVAHEYHEQTRVIQGMIDATRHEQLLPGKYKEILSVIDQGEKDIALAENNPQNASIARNNARIGFEAAIRFYEEIRIAEREWMLQLSATEQLAEVVEAQLEGSRVIDGKPGEELDVDFWSYGDLSEHENTLTGLRERISNPDKLSIEDLIGIQSALKEVSSRIDSTYEGAYIAIATSQGLADEAEALHSDLNSRGALTVIDHAYENNDKRGNYRCVLRNSSGLTVVVTVTVSRGNEVQIETAADIVDYGTMAKHDAERLVNDAVERLVSGALQTQSRTKPHCHDRGGVVRHPERRDMESWRRGEHSTSNNNRTGGSSAGNTANTD